MPITPFPLRLRSARAQGTGNMVVRDNGGAADAKDEERVDIEMQEPVTLNFALRYLKSFSKAAPLATRVQLCLSGDMPLLVKYEIEGDGGHLSFYLVRSTLTREVFERGRAHDLGALPPPAQAPKIDEDEG